MPTDHQPGAPIYDSLIKEQGDVLAAARQAADGVRAQSEDLRKISSGPRTDADTDAGANVHTHPSPHLDAHPVTPPNPYLDTYPGTHASAGAETGAGAQAAAEPGADAAPGSGTGPGPETARGPEAGVAGADVGGRQQHGLDMPQENA